MRILYQNAYVALLNRIENSLRLSAEEIYNRFLEQYPFIFSRVPLHLIASYMGITPVTLSRIRRQAAGVIANIFDGIPASSLGAGRNGNYRPERSRCGPVQTQAPF